MNVHISYKIEKTAHLEQLIQKNLEKLQRHLQVFRPELVHFKGVLGEGAAREGYSCSLNLRLPSGQLAAQESSPVLDLAFKAALDDIVEQLKKHKEVLRHHHRWQRRRGGQRSAAGTVPFEETIAAVKPETVLPGDIANYVNVNLPRLERYIRREIEYWQSEGLLRPDQVTVDDVVGEAIADALGESHEKPERIKLEPWLYRLATDAIRRLASPSGEGGRIPLGSSYERQAAQDGDQVLVPTQESEEGPYADEVLPDSTGDSPEELAARWELMGLIERALQVAGRDEREAFLLFTIEGFTVPEIADIIHRPEEEVRTFIRSAREHLERALLIQDPLKDKLVEYSKST